MKRVATAALSVVLTCTGAAWGAPQAPVVEAPRIQARDVGYSLGAAGLNVFYFPLRFAVTTVTAFAGGLTGFMIGGDAEAADAIWDVTNGQAYITPSILDGSEPLHPFVRGVDHYTGGNLGAATDYGDIEPEAPVSRGMADQGAFESYETMEESEPY